MCLFVRDLRFDESQKLNRWLRNSRNGIQMRRAQVIAFSGQGMRVQEISSHLGMNEEYLRELIRNFNEAGFSALKQRRKSGRPPRLSEEERSLIVEIATAPPQAFGRPFNQWYASKAPGVPGRPKAGFTSESHDDSTCAQAIKGVFPADSNLEAVERSPLRRQKNASKPSTKRRRRDRQ